MLEVTDELLFSDDILIFDEEEQTEVEKEKWKLLIIDDDIEVHNVTKMVLSRFEFEGKKLDMLSAYTGIDARVILNDNPDIAVILLDVVMEEDDTGLKMVKLIREELDNKNVRIILRTGQPGQAPEERVVIDYDINDYKEKTELTSQKLYTTIISALRAYRDITAIETGKKGLENIVDTFSEVFFEQSLKEFASKVLKKLSYIINLYNACYTDSSSFAAMKSNDRFYILAATGDFQGSDEKDLAEVVDSETAKYLYKAYGDKKNIYEDGFMVIFLRGMSGTESLIYFKGCIRFNVMMRELIDVFSSNVSAVSEAIISSGRYEAERQKRALSEKLRELAGELASTLELRGVLTKLLDKICQIVSCSRGLAVLPEEGVYRVVVSKEGDKLITTDCILEDSENEIVEEVLRTGRPFLCEGLSILSFDQRLWLQSCLAVPISYQGKVSGTILLQDAKANAFGSIDEDLAMTYASQAGIAIENAMLFYQVAKRNADIKNLLDNAGQGFMTFGEDLKIKEGYSQECINIFGRNVDGVKFTELIYDDHQQDYLEIMLLKILNIEKAETRQIYFPLLPGEIYVNDKHIQISYKIIEDPEDSTLRIFMVILTDISEKKLLENRIEKERNILRMVVKAVTEYEDLVKCIREYEEFCRIDIYEILKGEAKSDSVIFEIMRRVHNFKGSFSQLDFIDISAKLHEFETELSELRGMGDGNVLEVLRNRISTGGMLNWLSSDLNILTDVLGEQYLKHEKIIYIDQAELMKIEKRLETCIPADIDCKELLNDLRKLRYRPFKEVLKHYPSYVEKLALRLNKKINPLEIKGGQFLIDHEKYKNFAKTLVHVFRNAVDHGVELPEERVFKNKCESGNIVCAVELMCDEICVTISDDGNGISVDKLKNAALEHQILDECAVCSMEEDGILNLVFEEFFTTRTKADEYSGRGVGLAAVKTEVEKLGGTIEVKTKEGEGTSFTFRFKHEM